MKGLSMVNLGEAPARMIGSACSTLGDECTGVYIPEEGTGKVKCSGCGIEYMGSRVFHQEVNNNVRDLRVKGFPAIINESARCLLGMISERTNA